MINKTIATVRMNKSNGQKTATIPKDSDIEVGDLVRIVKVRIEDEE